ncbi:MAG: glycosyltransferase [Candidatus Bathyarchaeia archaeon]
MLEQPTQSQGPHVASDEDSPSKPYYLSRMKVVLAGYLTIHELERIRDYLVQRVGRLELIGLTTFETRGVNPVVVLYENAKMTREIRLPMRLKPPRFLHTFFLFVSYCIHLTSIILLAIRSGEVFDLFIGVSYTPALAGTVLKKIGLTRSLIYYAYDYEPTPPNSNLFTALTTRLFQVLDLRCARSADVTWNLSEAIVRTRRTITEDRAPESDILVPYPLVPTTSYPTRVRKNTAGFIGNLRAGQGVELALDAIPIIRTRVPEFRLLIIGSGPLEPQLKKYVEKQKLDRNVAFLGFIRDKKKVQEILSSCSLGLAPYFRDPYSLVNYGYPGKVKTYLECGLPVVMTDVADISEEIRRRRAGLLIDYDAKQLADAVIRILTNKRLHDELRRNVRTITKRSNPQTVLDRAFALSRDRIMAARNRKT